MTLCRLRVYSLLYSLPYPPLPSSCGRMAGMGAINVPRRPPPAEKTEKKKFCRGVRGGLHVGYLLKSNFIVLQLLRDEEGWRDKAD